MNPDISKLAVFGATGGTGRLLVEKALEAGLEVTAFVRDPARLSLRHPALRVVVGDVLDPDAVGAAVAGQDAVACCLGAPALSKARLRTRGTAVIVDAMERHGVHRLVCQSSYGVGDTAELLPWFLKWVVVPLYLSRAFADHDAQETLVRDSELAWTLVRPPTLTDGPATGVIVHGLRLDPSVLAMKVPRADVAAFMLGQMGSDAYLRQAPVVSA